MAKNQVKYLLLLCGVSSWLVLFGCDSSALETGQFEAEVSGNDWRGRGYAEYSSQGELIIRASRWQGEDLEEFLIYVDFDGTKTYLLAEGKARFRISIGGDLAGALYKSFEREGDRIIISEYDPSQGRFVGTFSFDARGKEGDLSVRKGRFDVAL